jgi:tetratricopeptide (TPR) repeat protein
MERFDLMIKCVRDALQYGLSISNFIASKGFGVVPKSTELFSAIKKYNKCLYLDVIKDLKPIFRQDRNNVLSGYFVALSYKYLKNYENSCNYFKRISNIPRFKI